MGFKRTPEGRVFFQGTDSANDESAPRPKSSNPSPQMRSPLTGEKTQGQIVTLLKTLNERLKVTQEDRDRMMKELEKHKNIIDDLEGRAERSEKLAIDLKGQIGKGARAAAQTDSKETISELEKTRKALSDMERKQSAYNKALADKVSKSTSGVNALKRRVESAEAKQSVIDERIEAALSEQAKIIRKVDKAIEDRARFMRKIERIEETVIQTRDALNAKAMVLLTEQGASAGQEINEGVAKYLPDDLEEQISEAAQRAKRVADIQAPSKGLAADTGIYAKQNALPWWKNASVMGAIAGLVAFILAVLVIGVLAVNDWRWPSNDSAYTDIQDYTPQNYTQLPPPTSQAQSDLQSPQAIENMDWAIDTTQSQTAPQETAPSNLADIDLNNAAQVEQAMEESPQQLASALNQIEAGDPVAQQPETAPQVAEQAPQPLTPEPTPAPEPVAAPIPAEPQPTPIEATKPNPTQATSLASQMQRDPNLPNVMRSVEDQAFEGIGEAQHDLAAIYTAGHGGVKQDYKRAALWFEKAAENGIANASYNLGVLHHQGLGFEPDVKEAMKWYKDAAAKGHPEAQYNLGIAYIEGIGVPYDPVTASNYFESAANNGVMEAAYNLGLIYENGLLGDAAPDKALLWYKTASDQGSPEAKQALTDLAKNLGISTQDVNSMVDEMRRSSQPSAPDLPTSTPQKESSVLQSPPNFSDYSDGAADQGTIAQIQEYLMREGLYPGPADGIGGALTQDAIRSYQSQHNMDVTGTPTQNLLGHMLANANQSAVYQKAMELGSSEQ